MNGPPCASPALKGALLAPEWERLTLLCQAAALSRRGQPLDAVDLERLQRLQDRVQEVRRSGGPWSNLLPHATAVELDLLACVLAPEVEPRLGRWFQELQPGIAEPYPSAALIQELLAMAPHEAHALHDALSPAGRLRATGLIRSPAGSDLYAPLRVAEGVAARLMGRPAQSPPPPATTPVPAAGGWKDLVLPAGHEALLREFLLWIQHRRRVVDDWGGTPSGGPVALFTGASGTGKTLAASVLAAELGWPLYRVDLGRLVSKYVGEPERNLNALFDAAHGRPMLLQFDEADSLFGRRGELKEARDRYANMEVSHLLTRIEVHQGPCILTSNLRKHLDPAFARRFQMVVEFPRPNVGDRTRLWERLLPPRAPRLARVLPGELARAVNLTGGQIRNAALHAAYLAAGAATPMDLPHIAQAVWRELCKAGEERTPRELGPLAAHLPEAAQC